MGLNFNYMKEEIKKRKKQQDYVQLTRNFAPKKSMDIDYGVIQDYSKELIQLHVIVDFEFIQSIIFPINDLAKIRYNRTDKFYNKILKKEKVLKKSKCIKSYDIKNWSTLFNSLKSKCIIVETENSKGRTFHIGGVVKVKKSKIGFLYFDALGKVEKPPYSIAFKDITKVTLDSNYSEIFQKYVREK